jgi:hypothetical protein
MEDLLSDLRQRAIEDNMTCIYIDADDIFKAVDQEGVPLMLIVELLHSNGATCFPWYGFARRRWHSGKNKSSIIAEIRDALSLNRGFDTWQNVIGDLKNLWPELAND